MNTGIIASRYATALLKLVDETGGGEAVMRQVQMIRKALETVPDLRRAVADRTAVSPSQKVSLIEAVVAHDGGNESLAPELRKLVQLLVKNGRIGDISLVLSSFETEYYRSRGIVRGFLKLSHPKDSATEELENKIKELIESKTGKSLLLVTEVDESLIGGFVLEVEDRLLDASVSHQLEMIQRQFVEKNRRIV